MSINYQNSSLCIIYEGKIFEILKGNLKDIDNFTKDELSKFSLLKKFILSNNMDRETSSLLSLINENLPNDYLLDDEYNSFNFFITTKSSSKAIILPVLYRQYSMESKDIIKELLLDENLLQVINTYSRKIETDPDNKNIIHDISKIQTELMKSNLDSELLVYDELEEKRKNGIWLEEDTYKYYQSLKNEILNRKNRDELVERFMKNIQQSHFKKRSLCIILKLYKNELSEFDASIAQAIDNEYGTLEAKLLEKTIRFKK